MGIRIKKRLIAKSTFKDNDRLITDLEMTTANLLNNNPTINKNNKINPVLADNKIESSSIKKDIMCLKKE